MAENEEITSLFKSMGLPIPRQFSGDPKSFLTQLVKQYSKGGDTTKPKTPVKKQDFLGAVEKAASEPDFGVTKEGVADKLLKGKLTDPQPTREQAVNTALEKAKADLALEEAQLKKLHLAEREREQAVNTALEKAEGAREDAMTAALSKAESEAKAGLDLEEAQLKKLHLAEREREQAVNTALEKAEGAREEAMTAALAKVDSDLDVEEEALKEETLDMRKADQDKDAYFEGGVADKLAKGELTDPKKESLEDLRKFNRLFKEVHGSNTSYDSNSETDRKKKAEMDAMLAESGGIKNVDEDDFTQFALDYYREYNYV